MNKVLIKEIGKVITGNTPSKSNLEYYDSNDIFFIKPDIINDLEVTNIEYTKEYISEKARNKARIVKRNTVFVTCIGTIGKIGIASGDEFAFNQQINAIEPNDRVLPRYLAYNLLFNKKRLINIANAPVVPIINKTQFESFSIDIDENLDKQKRIVEVLDKVKIVIDKRKKQLEELDKLIKSQFIEMFGDPIINSKNLKIYLLSELSNLKAGKNIKANNLHEQDQKYQYPCYGGNGIRGYIEKFSHIGTFSLIGRQGALCGNIQLATGEFYVTEHAVVVTPIVELNTYWLYYMLSFLNLNRLQTGAAQPGLNIEILNNVEIPFDNIDKQDKFACFAEQTNKQKFILQQNVYKLQELFNSLMKKFFIKSCNLNSENNFEK